MVPFKLYCLVKNRFRSLAFGEKKIEIGFIFYRQVYDHKLQVKFEFGYNPPIIMGAKLWPLFGFIYTALSAL